MILPPKIFYCFDLYDLFLNIPAKKHPKYNGFRLHRPSFPYIFLYLFLFVSALLLHIQHVTTYFYHSWYYSNHLYLPSLPYPGHVDPGFFVRAFFFTKKGLPA